MNMLSSASAIGSIVGVIIGLIIIFSGVLYKNNKKK